MCSPGPQYLAGQRSHASVNRAGRTITHRQSSTARLSQSGFAGFVISNMLRAETYKRYLVLVSLGSRTKQAPVHCCIFHHVQRTMLVQTCVARSVKAHRAARTLSDKS
jgi:hypothetical protein